MINVSSWSIKNPIPAVMLFVMLCFAFSQSDFAFDSTVLPVEVERHQGESTLFDLANQSPNLIFLQQQFFGARAV